MTEQNEQVLLAQKVKTLRDNMPAMLEYAGLSAKLMARRFFDLKKEGFATADALDLCKFMHFSDKL